ncbi:hypothetical protein D3C81_2134520 [compost metagenome]
MRPLETVRRRGYLLDAIYAEAANIPAQMAKSDDIPFPLPINKSVRVDSPLKRQLSRSLQIAHLDGAASRHGNLQLLKQGFMGIVRRSMNDIEADQMPVDLV